MTNNYNDKALIDSIKKGESKAFSFFIDQHKNLVYSLALRMLRNREEAEEVAQDSFVKVFKNIGTFKGDSQLSTWVYKIVYYSCLDRIKKNKRKSIEVSIKESFDISDNDAISVLDRMFDDELRSSVESCIDRLGPEDGFLITLFYFEELSLDEISKVVGLKSNTIKVKLFRARKKLAEIFKSTLETEIIERYARN